MDINQKFILNYLREENYEKNIFKVITLQGNIISQKGNKSYIVCSTEFPDIHFEIPFDLFNASLSMPAIKSFIFLVLALKRVQWKDKREAMQEKIEQTKKDLGGAKRNDDAFKYSDATFLEYPMKEPTLLSDEYRERFNFYLSKYNNLTKKYGKNCKNPYDYTDINVIQQNITHINQLFY